MAQPLARDTHPAIERLQLRIIGGLPPWRKVQLTAELNALLSGLSQSPECGTVQGTRAQSLDDRRLGPALAQILARERHARGLTAQEEDSMSGNPLPPLLVVIAALDSCGIDYFIGGSLASSIHGLYRATADVDLIARVTSTDVDRLSSLLQHRFYADQELMRDAIARRSAFNLLDLETGFKVDIFVDPADRYAQAQFARRRILAIASDGTTAFVASIEDTVLAKLRWYDAGGRSSERQWTDILGVLRVQQRAVDLPYLRRWATALGLAALLEDALTAAYGADDHG